MSNNGPAWFLGSHGMTLRDYFAARAPAFPFAQPEIFPGVDLDPSTKVANLIADWNYAYADAMLRKRAE